LDTIWVRKKKEKRGQDLTQVVEYLTGRKKEARDDLLRAKPHKVVVNRAGGQCQRGSQIQTQSAGGPSRAKQKWGGKSKVRLWVSKHIYSRGSLQFRNKRQFSSGAGDGKRAKLERKKIQR